MRIESVIDAGSVCVSMALTITVCEIDFDVCSVAERLVL